MIRSLLLPTAAAVLVAAAAGAPGPREIAYGSDPLQRIDVTPAPSGTRAPLVVFVHGGAWTFGDKRGVWAKPAFFAQQGDAFASVNYRLVPQVRVEDQAKDLAAAIAKLRAEAPALGVDPNRIALIGHSAGAHLAALVGTDEEYLRDAGVPMKAVKAIVLLDGAGYDVPKQAHARAGAEALYTKAFGPNAQVQWRLSPVAHAAAPNVAAWDLYAVASRAVSPPQADELAAALTKAGAVARVTRVPDSSHMQINRGFGTPGDSVAPQVALFLKRYL